ncbi:MAG: hypothetical protein J6Z11_07150 [Candidatus Riflebacteria bacterium]|nr:hypothetical protein [Candidatus Riflebacteria bacterium]
MSLINKRSLSRKAITFVEILIAIFIIGVGIIPVLSLFLKGTRTVETGGNIFQVAVAAQNIMDTARCDSYIWRQEIPLDFPINANRERGLYLPLDLVKKYKATARLKIDEAKGHTILDTGEPEVNLYQIDVEVNWEENGVKKHYSLMNYRANINTQTMKTSTRFE